MLPCAGPPLDPTAEEARRWATEELAKPAYRPSLLERVLTAVWNWFSSLGGGGTGVTVRPWLFALGLAVVLGLAVMIVVAVQGRRRSSPTGGGSGAVLGESGLTGAAYRARARAALAAGDADTALLDAVRTVAARTTERALAPEAPGRTAHELALALGPLFPGEASALREVADEFDAVRYGGRHTGLERARSALDLEARLDATRPQFEAGSLAVSR